MGVSFPSVNLIKVIPHICAQKPIFQGILIKLILPEPSPLCVQGAPAIGRPVGLGLRELRTF